MLKNYIYAIMNALNEAVIVVANDGYIETVNKSACEMLGYQMRDLINNPISIIFKDGLFAPEVDAPKGKDERPFSNFNKACCLKSGERIYVSFSGSILYNDNGNIDRIIFVANDIRQNEQLERERKFAAETNLRKADELEKTINHLKIAQDISIESMRDLEIERARLEIEGQQRKKLERIYASEKERLSVTMHSIADGVIATDEKGNVTMLNKAARQLTGWTRNDALGRPLNTIFHIVEEKTGNSLKSTLEDGFKKRSLFTFMDNTVLIAKDKTEKFISSSIAPILDKDDQIIGAVLVFRDITRDKQFEKEKEEMRAQMVNGAKLASLGEIAAGVAHEINQPLTYISSFAQNLERDLNEGCVDETILKKKLSVSINQITKIDNIIQHMRTFGRRDDIVKRPLQIKDVLENTLLLMGEHIRLKNVDLKINIEDDAPEILGSPTQLEQVFINLFQNAVDAFAPDSDKPSINVDIATAKSGQDCVVIKISDNGMGIDNENLLKVFEPFFTTKEVGKGTGLGLSIIYGIIRDHNGEIKCESAPNKGATFIITLPVSKN